MEVSGRKVETKEEYLLCEPCQAESEIIRADGLCMECEEYMCQTCFSHHLKAKACRNHALIDASQSSITLRKRLQNEEKCQQHNNETVKFYCPKHETVGCGDCMVLGQHNTCKPEYIKDVAKNFQNKEEFKSLIKKLEKFEADNKNNEKTIQENRRENKLMNEKAVEEIRKFRIDINTYLDKAEADILSKAKQLTTENENLMAELEKHGKSVGSDIEEVKGKLDTQLHQGNVLFIHTVKCKQTFGSIDKTLADVKSKNVVKSFAFTPDKELCGIVTAAKELGSFSIISSNRTSNSAGAEQTKAQRSVGARKTESKDPKAALFVRGARVRRGPDWYYGNDDGNGPGTVTSVSLNGYVLVKWDHTGITNGYYRVGAEGAFDLEIVY